MGSYVKVFLTLTPSRILPFTQIDLLYFLQIPGFPGGSNIRVCLQCRRTVFSPWVGKIPGRGKWLLAPVFLPGESHRQRSLWATVHGVSKSQTLSLSLLLDMTYLFVLGCLFPFFCMSNYKFLSKSILMSHMIYEAFSKCPNPDSHDLLQKWQMYLHWHVDNLAMLLSRLFFELQNGPSFSLCKCSYFECWGFILHNSSCPLTDFFTDLCNTQFKRFLLFQCIIFKITFTQKSLYFPCNVLPELKSRSTNCNKDNHSF